MAALTSGQYLLSREHVLASVFSNTIGMNIPHTTPLYKLYNAVQNDRFLTTSVEEMQDAMKNRGYEDQGITAYIYPDAQASCAEMVPLYRLYNSAIPDHNYVLTKPSTNSSGMTTEGYVYEGITGYVFPPADSGELNSLACCGSHLIVILR